jgi:hypothetical protein
MHYLTIPLNTISDFATSGASTACASSTLKLFAAALALDTAVEVPSFVRNLRLLGEAGIPGPVRSEILELADVMEKVFQARAPTIVPRREDP